MIIYVSEYYYGSLAILLVLQRILLRFALLSQAIIFLVCLILSRRHHWSGQAVPGQEAHHRSDRLHPRQRWSSRSVRPKGGLVSPQNDYALVLLFRWLNSCFMVFQARKLRADLEDATRDLDLPCDDTVASARTSLSVHNLTPRITNNGVLSAIS